MEDKSSKINNINEKIRVKEMKPEIYLCLADQWSTFVPERSYWDLTVILSFYKLYPWTFDSSESRYFSMAYPQPKESFSTC